MADTYNHIIKIKENKALTDTYNQKKKINRVVIAGMKSGCGKTMITMGLIRAFIKKGLKVSARKCGPDYVDPSFHRKALSVETGNLDSYFCEPEILNYLLSAFCDDSDLTLIEGVMGYYDGLAGISERASTYEIARVTRSPVVLVADASAVSVTLSSMIKGILDYKKDNNIKAIILNKVSPAYYERIKSVVENYCNIKVIGYLPKIKDIEIPSRHLGLMQAEEIDRINLKIDITAEKLAESVELKEILKIAGDAPAPDTKIPEPILETVNYFEDKNQKGEKITVAIARDEAFSFYYDDNIRFIKQMGVNIVYFSPVRDERLPDDINGLILYGGYPEYYAEKLSKNTSMLRSVNEALKKGLPVIAECGGFLYLQRSLRDLEDNEYRMCGVIDGIAYNTGKSVRFGYVEATALEDGIYGEKGTELLAHEFHYYDCSLNGNDFEAKKPMAGGSYRCMFHKDMLAAGFLHIYAFGNITAYKNFLSKCFEYGNTIK
ncbi:MAG: cobyrinate a,c-diamide synthase [Lachnospiraceae bacterium]|nr:cobyrinate a,c-diamide synthase [Lachnospiraceae bacterium]